MNIVTLKNAALMAGLTVLLCGCNSGDKDKKDERSNHVSFLAEGENEMKVEDKAEAKSVFNKAFAVISSREGSDVVGAVTFTEVEGGVRIVADIGGLQPGKHGFHIHEHGDCSAPDASSAGGHYNPTNTQHGGPDSSARHIGDLGNVEANEAGFAHYDRIDKVISLKGEHAIVGKSVVVHADEDDLETQPTGNSGKRIGCGVIVGSNQE